VSTEVIAESRFARAWNRFWWAIPLAVALFAYRGSFTYDYIADAVFLLEHNTFLEDLSHLWGTLTHDYFWSSSGNTIPYWRPVTKGMWLLEAAAFGIHPTVFHAFQFLWFSVAIGGVMALTRLLGAPRLVAALAGGLFALHPAAFEPVCLLMARSDVIGAAAALWTVFFWKQWVDGDSRAVLFHVLCFLLALGAKESALVVAPLLTLWAMAPPDGEALRRPDLSRVARSVGWVWGLGLGWMVLRGWMLEGAGGVSLGIDPLRIVTGMSRYLMGVLPLQLETGLFNVSVTQARELLPVSLTVVGLLGAAMIAALRFRRYSVAVMLCWIPAVLAPVLLVEQLNVPNVLDKFPVADRWLFPAAAAACVVFGVVIHAIRHRTLRHLAMGLVVVWGALAAWVAPGTHGDFASAETLLDREDAQLALVESRHWTLEDRCRATERNIARAAVEGRPADVLRLDATMPGGCPETVKRRFNRLAALVELKRFSEAVLLADALLAAPEADTRERPVLHLLAGIALSRSGRASDAVPMFREAERLGLSSCTLEREAASAHLSLQEWEDGARRLEGFHRCASIQGGVGAASILLDAGRAWREAGREGEALRVLETARAESEPGSALHEAIQRAVSAGKNP
jgi:hypothetical protein